MAKYKPYQELLIRLPEREYPILIGHYALQDPEFLNQFVPSKQVLIVSNETIAPLYLQAVEAAFAEKQCNVVILKDGERYKNSANLFQILDTLIAKNHHRDTTLIALGGGVIGDITGFAASIYQRGVSFIQIPTTVLAQVDASIGGKTAINHPKAKNMIGSFYQPSAVIIDINSLQSLEPREFRAGIAEIIKYAILEGKEFNDLVNSALSEGLANNKSEKLPAIISQCCQIKSRFVQEDEREQGRRALLNLGHTFAHALESYGNYECWLHGEAVAIGLYCAAVLSEIQGNIDDKTVRLIDKMLVLARLPNRIPKDVDLKKLRTLMSQDKKIQEKELRFILLNQIGDCYISGAISEFDLQLALQKAVEGDEHVRQSK